MSWQRALYTALVWTAMPLAAVYLLWRSRRQPEYRHHWGERFGWARYPRVDGSLIWVHAVSLGETRAAAPLVDALATRLRHHAFLLTHMTPTGRAAGAELAARWPGRITQIYLPYDLPFAVRRMLRHYRPRVGIGMETEAWPNLLAIARAEEVPMVLANARLSERSLAKAQRARDLFAAVARSFTCVLAQTDDDARRLRLVGATDVEVVGNLKFDLDPDPGLLQAGRAARRAASPVLLFANTRDGEEALVLDALRAQRARVAALGAKVVVVPRHPQRFDDVARLALAHGFVVTRRSRFSTASEWLASEPPDAIFLGDSMGEMAMYYAAADVAFVGGSLLRLGGHNLIEACAVGTPVVVGTHTFNFAQAADHAIAAGAAVRVEDADGALDAMLQIAADPPRQAAISAAATHFAQQHRGATARTVARLLPLVTDAA